ncbi:MAG: peptidylprolyl isomerase [Planctomycetota bacterium]
MTRILALIAACGLMLFASAAPIQASEVQVTWEATRYFVEGEALMVHLRLEVVGEQPVELEPWALSAAAFSVDGHALGGRTGKKSLALEPGQVLETRLNLAKAVTKLDSFNRRHFQLSYHGAGSTQPQQILFFEAAEKGIEFMELPKEQLADYQVLLRTNRGDIWIDLWPDVAENHVRNYLDLAYTGYYDGSQFHRVIPNFMIQGGRNKQGIKAPRTLNAEFSDRKHVRGVLSMARLGDDINSATTEFFLMHVRYPSLDGKYTAFGQTIEGLEVIDKIVVTGNPTFSSNDPRGFTPTSPQVIERALVVRKVAPPEVKEPKQEEK